MATIREALEAAVKHHQANRLHDAEAIYRQILAVDPKNPHALHLIGVLASQVGRYGVAVDYITRAIAIHNTDPIFHNNLGAALKNLGRLEEAAASYRRSIALNPNSAEPQYNLALALHEQGRLDDAIPCYQRALQLRPDYFEAYNNLGNILKDQGKLEEAVACYRRALQIRPDYEAAYNNLANALREQGKLEEAVACYRRALDLRPGYGEAEYNLGNVLHNQGKLDDAAACFAHARQSSSDSAAACNNLGTTLKDQGRLDDAIASFRDALRIQPDLTTAHSNIVYTMVFSPRFDPSAILKESRRWNQQHARPLAQFIQPHLNSRDPSRRLRIGYVSPDFRHHAESHFTVPLLASHDHANFEIFCYADVARPDHVTARLQSCADVWRNVTGFSDERIAQLIREDRIDILVDLTMHMARNHLLAFARKPAPLQVCWLAYQGTTGLDTMDYRLTDVHCDPPGLFDRFYSEQSIRLGDSFGCYDPLATEPTVNDLPALNGNGVTFASLNNFCKINPSVLQLWAQVMNAVPRSRLLILAVEGSHRQRALDLLQTHGVGPDRVSFAANRPRSEYLKLYHQIDVCLDTFPYNGQTTTLDALWMGVPVVTLPGPTAVGRAGLSLLTTLAMPELIAHTPQQFVQIATDLANNLSQLSRLRATLRQTMERSPLMDGPRFARHVEQAYRNIWQTWCAKPT